MQRPTPNDSTLSVARTGSARQVPNPADWFRRHPLLSDAMLASAFTAISLAFHLAESNSLVESVTEPDWWTVLLVAGSVAPVAWRRVHPVAVTLIVTVIQVATTVSNVFGPEFIGVVIALYSLGVHATGAPRRRALGVVIGLISLLFVAGLVVEELTPGLFLSSTILLVTAFVVGDNLRRRRDAAAALQERLERSERERELLARERVGAERARIARELHDVVAHSVSAMVIQAGAARRTLATAPASAETALTNIEHLGREAMNELRGVLGVLRRSEGELVEFQTGDGSDANAPQPTLADVALLIEAMTDLPITTSVNGDLTDLAPSTDLTGYRIVQESLTNVRRHAGPVRTVTVDIDRGDHSVTIVIEDDGRGASAVAGDEGYGIVGMRERVEAVGGEVAAGCRSSGGWRVAATLPIGVPA